MLGAIALVLDRRLAAQTIEQEHISECMIGDNDGPQRTLRAAHGRVVELGVAAVINVAEPAKDVHVLVRRLMHQHLGQRHLVWVIRHMDDAWLTSFAAAAHEIVLESKRDYMT